MKKFLYKYLPYLPVSLPVLLFCRLAELTAMLESETLLTRADWEAAVHEKILLSWVANDVKIIGILFLEFFLFCFMLTLLLFRSSHRVLWTVGHPRNPADAFRLAFEER